MVVNFSSPVTFSAASASAGTVAGTSVSGNTVTVNLTNVPDAQTISINLQGVNDGARIADVTIPMSVLLGDTTSSGEVNSADISQAKANSGQAPTAETFRTDVTVNGIVNGSDVSLVKSKSGASLGAAAKR